MSFAAGVARVRQGPTSASMLCVAHHPLRVALWWYEGVKRSERLSLLNAVAESASQMAPPTKRLSSSAAATARPAAAAPPPPRARRGRRGVGWRQVGRVPAKTDVHVPSRVVDLEQITEHDTRHCCVDSDEAVEGKRGLMRASRGGVRLFIAHIGPLQREQHGVQRLGGSTLDPARPKRRCQRMDNLLHLSVGARELHALTSHVQRPLLGCHVVLSVIEASRRADRQMGPLALAPSIIVTFVQLSGSGGRKIPVVSAGGANGSGGVATAAVGVGAAEGAGATERVRSGAEVRIGIATAAVGVGVLHASIEAVATAVGGGALRSGSAKLELYPHQGVVGAGAGAGTRTGVYLAFSAAESFSHIWPRGVLYALLARGAAADSDGAGLLADANGIME
eukprot:scaffold133331_cov62-Phaeocystis_antarctica.AAC.1